MSVLAVGPGNCRIDLTLIPSHIQSACSSSNLNCAICSGPHVSTKESPCKLPAECANCGGPHVLFSLKCQVLKKVISAAK